MGCDGGTIPKRDELVRTQKKPEQVDKDAEISAKWKHCALSQNELKAPIVSCELGRLYNKDAVIEYLLDKTSTNDIASHIRNLKDIVQLKLTPNPAYAKIGADMGDEYIDRQTSEYICPVTGIEMSGRYRFVFPRLCGCVVSERSLKEIKSDKCHKCGQVYTEDDLIVLNGTKEDVDRLTARMTERRLRDKRSKKAKRDSAKANLDVKEEPKKRKVGSAATSSALMTPDSHGSMTAAEKKALGSYSVAEDPSASEAFKSLFTTHESCKRQQRAHWVTYNPLYN